MSAIRLSFLPLLCLQEEGDAQRRAVVEVVEDEATAKDKLIANSYDTCGVPLTHNNKSHESVSGKEITGETVTSGFLRH